MKHTHPLRPAGCADSKTIYISPLWQAYHLTQMQFISAKHGPKFDGPARHVCFTETRGPARPVPPHQTP